MSCSQNAAKSLAKVFGVRTHIPTAHRASSCSTYWHDLGFTPLTLSCKKIRFDQTPWTSASIQDSISSQDISTILSKIESYNIIQPSNHPTALTFYLLFEGRMIYAAVSSAQAATTSSKLSLRQHCHVGLARIYMLCTWTCDIPWTDLLLEPTPIPTLILPSSGWMVTGFGSQNPRQRDGRTSSASKKNEPLMSCIPRYTKWIVSFCAWMK